MIAYPEEFKKRVRKAYPNREDILRKLENGDEDLVTYLIHLTRPISFYDLLKVKTLEDLERLKEEARIEIDRGKLYEDGVRIKSN